VEYATIPDAELVRRVLSGETEAYAGLVSRYRERFGRYATRMLGDQHDAEEALQDAFVRAFRALSSCDTPERFGPWLLSILANRCRTAGARRTRRTQTIVTDERAVYGAHVDQGVDAAAWREEIERGLARLDPVLREAFVLKHVNELSYDEMHEITGAGVSALKMRVKRACQRMRAMLEEAERV